MSGLPGPLEVVIERAAPLTERFARAGHRLYFVGGVVRDHLLERTRAENDLDATTDAHPAEIKALVADLADAVWTQGERFGTIGCRVDGQVYEITTHRAEVYDDDSRKPNVAFGDRLEDDLARRDFTVNAMAVDLNDGTLIDPYGGRRDLVDRVLRTPLDPSVSFSDDPLRMLRAARFVAGYGLAPTEELLAAIMQLGDRLDIVSVERIRDEVEKLLLLDDAGAGLALLAQTALLGRAIPPLDGLSVDGVGERSRRVAAVAIDPAARWAALLAPEVSGPAPLRALRFSSALTRDVLWFVSGHAWAADPGGRPADDPTIRRDAAAAPAGRALAELVAWVEALRRVEGGPLDDVSAYRENLARLTRVEPDLADPPALLDGDAICTLLDLAPGPEVGVAASWLRELRFDQGPMAEAEAAARLAEWWADRPTH